MVTAHAVLNATGLDRFFEHLISRDCVINGKPYPEGINKILSSLQASKDHTLMVGDHKLDIEAAKAAGIKAISICWDGTESNLSSISDYYFQTVSELYNWASQNLDD